MSEIPAAVASILSLEPLPRVALLALPETAGVSLALWENAEFAGAMRRMSTAGYQGPDPERNPMSPEEVDGNLLIFVYCDSGSVTTVYSGPREVYLVARISWILSREGIPSVWGAGNAWYMSLHRADVERAMELIRGDGELGNAIARGDMEILWEPSRGFK